MQAYLFTRGIRGFAAKDFRGCVKRFLPPAPAEYYFETDVSFMIVLDEIIINTPV